MMKFSSRYLIRNAVVKRLRDASQTWPDNWAGDGDGEDNQLLWRWNGPPEVHSIPPHYRQRRDIPDICVVSTSDTVDLKAPLTPGQAIPALTDGWSEDPTKGAPSLSTWIRRIVRVDIEATLQLPFEHQTELHDQADAFAEAIRLALDGWTPTGWILTGPAPPRKMWAGVDEPVFPEEIRIGVFNPASEGGPTMQVLTGLDVGYFQNRVGWTPESNERPVCLTDGGGPDLKGRYRDDNSHILYDFDGNPI